MHGSGHERRRGLAIERGDAREREVIDDVTLLLLEGRRDGEDAFGEATAGGAMSAPAAFAPEDGRPQGTLGGVVRRLDVRDVDERPEGGRNGQQVATRGGG